jgi:NifU-like protein involved in Fe-S cluster formation
VTSDALYHEAILRLARSPGAGRLDAPHASASRDNPLCGDEATFDVRVGGGTVLAVGRRVRGCALCQAAGAVAGAVTPGRTPADVSAARAALAAMLGGGPAPPEPWEELAVFLPVRDVPSRHGCVLLPFDALRDALGRALRANANANANAKE